MAESCSLGDVKYQRRGRDASRKLERNPGRTVKE
jgi:hypothetical protein